MYWGSGATRESTMGMQVSFARHKGRHHHIYATRTDGSSADWAFPSYGDDLPHDLCHLVVEDALGIAKGFWGLVGCIPCPRWISLHIRSTTTKQATTPMILWRSGRQELRCAGLSRRGSALNVLDRPIRRSGRPVAHVGDEHLGYAATFTMIDSLKIRLL